MKYAFVLTFSVTAICASSFATAQLKSLRKIERAFISENDPTRLDAIIDEFDIESVTKALVQKNETVYLRLTHARRLHTYPGIDNLSKIKGRVRELIATDCIIREPFDLHILRMADAYHFALKFNLLTRHFVASKNESHDTRAEHERIRKHFHFTNRQWDELSLTSKLVLRYTLEKATNQLDSSFKSESANSLDDLDLDDFNN